MTDKTMHKTPDGSLVKTPGWFSWRHQTRDAHVAASARYLSLHGPEARRRRAQERAA